MVQFILFDFWVGLFTAAAMSIVSFTSFHAYRLGGTLRQSHFGFGFLFLSVSLLLGSIVNAQLRWPHLTDALRPYMLVDVVNGWLVIVAAAFLLFGLLTIFMTLERLDNKPVVFLVAHVVVLTIMIANEYFPIIYAEMTIFIGAIAVEFYRNWRRHRNVTSFCIMIGFIATFIAHAALVVSSFYDAVGVVYYVANAVAILFVFTGTLYLYVIPRHALPRRAAPARNRRRR